VQSVKPGITFGGVQKVFKHASSASFARASVAAVLGGTALLLWSSALFAAEAKKDDTKKEDDDQELSEVQVTGTRILSPNATSTNPITTISGEEMRRLGIVNVADALTQLVPQNISTYQPGLTGSTQMDGAQGGGMERGDRGSLFIGNTIANLRGMDPTFGSRTLTLVDGRRVVSTSNQADVVDLNVIPSNLMERMDIVTGGASATYGSGAMAGVVNIVLNRRVEGIRLDMDYGVSEQGDGGNPHLSLSGGTTLFGGKGHLTGNFEWRDQQAIRDCAAARDWCQESRFMFSNSSGGGTALTDPVTPQIGYEGLPRRFQLQNTRYSNFSPTSTLYVNSAAITTNYRFDNQVDPNTGLLGGETYALGYNGGVADAFGGAPNVMNGDGPLATSGQTLRPSQSSKQFFANFDYDFTPTTTMSVQATYGTTDGLNKNRYTRGDYCARFDSPVNPSRGTNAQSGTNITFSILSSNVIRLDTNAAYGGPFTARGSQWTGVVAPAVLVTNTIAPIFSRFLALSPANSTVGIGNSFASGNGYESAADLLTAPSASGLGPRPPRRGVAFPFYVPTSLSPNAPVFNFGGNAIGTWIKVRFNPAQYTLANMPNEFTTEFPNEYWVLDRVQLTTGYDLGSATVVPTLGRNAYAFLSTLSQEALYQVQNAFNNNTAAGGNVFGSAASGIGSLFGSTTCTGSTALRKVWNPQLQQTSENTSDRWTAQLGFKGRFGTDWRWDANYSWGSTESRTHQTNIATILRNAFAMDAVIDDRPFLADGVTANPTYGTPICRVERDGAPVLDVQGRPLSGAEGLANIARGCKPLNIFGTTYSNSAYVFDRDGNRFLRNGTPITYDAATIQQQALDYAFVDADQSGVVSLQTLQLTTSGTLWQGWAGPLTSALTLDVSLNKNNSRGTEGDIYVKSDLGTNYANAFGGKERQIEPALELNFPLISGQDGVDLLSVSGTYRHGFYYVKGGAGTTGEHSTQETPTWRFSAEFAPFDWVRFRMTRSKDMRAAGYRELFFYQPLEPDQFDIVNPWRPRTATSNENQRERYGQIQIGNPNLKPERSRTLTFGFVLSPGGWAQGMRFSADYSDIRVKDGITLPFNAQMPVPACFTQSGGKDPIFGPDGEITNPGSQDKFDENNQYCQLLRFAELTDPNGNVIPGSRDLQDLVSYTSAQYVNSLPYQTRAVDLSLSYNFPLNRVFESVPGSLSMTLRGTRALEASGIQNTFTFGVPPSTDPCARALEQSDPKNFNIDGSPLRDLFTNAIVVNNSYRCVDLVGQIGSNVFIPGVPPRRTGAAISACRTWSAI
jgi:outer membrane receptor protein involved in Fe transport